MMRRPATLWQYTPGAGRMVRMCAAARHRGIAAWTGKIDMGTLDAPSLRSCGPRQGSVVHRHDIATRRTMNQLFAHHGPRIAKSRCQRRIRCESRAGLARAYVRRAARTCASGPCP